LSTLARAAEHWHYEAEMFWKLIMLHS
jgi:hypothetical protein